jgi:hypothetical protein
VKSAAGGTDRRREKLGIPGRLTSTVIMYQGSFMIAGAMVKKLFRSCDRNSDFFRDLILMEVSEVNGVVRLIVRISL